MNAPIQALYTSGVNLYAILINNDDGTVYNTVTPGWEAYNSGHWAQYAVAVTEYPSSGYYRGTYPIASPTVLSTEIIFVRSGGSPSLADVPAINFYSSQGQNVAAVGNSWKSGQNMGLALGTQQIGAISGTPPSAISLTTNLTSVHIDAYAGRSIIMTSGALIQQAALITAYDGAGLLTINGFPSSGTPANTDTFIII